MELLTLILIAVVTFVVLSIVFKKAFLIPLIGGTALFVMGLYLLLDALDNLNGIINQISSYVTNSYDTYLEQKNLGIIFMVIGGILLLAGIIFAIKSSSKKKEQNTFVNNYYGAGASPAFPCGNCGSMIPAGTKFCPECGAPVQVPQPAGQRPDVRPVQNGANAGRPSGSSDNAGARTGSSARFEAPLKKNAGTHTENVCPQCGKPVSKGAKFCTACGSTISAAAPSVDSAAATAPDVNSKGTSSNAGSSITASQKRAGKKICPSCGVEVEEKSKFCLKCGQKFS